MKSHFKILLTLVLLIFNCSGCTSFLNEYAVATRLDKLDGLTYQQEKYPLEIAIITNTFSGFCFKPGFEEGVYYERGGCKSPVEKYHAVFEFPILSCSNSIFSKMFQRVDFIDANSYSQNRSQYNLVSRMILSKISNETTNARTYAALSITVRFEFRNDKGIKIFDSLISGYGKSKQEDRYGNKIDRYFDKKNMRNVDPAFYNYRSAAQNALIDVFVNLRNILNVHPNFIDNEFGVRFSQSK